MRFCTSRVEFCTIMVIWGRQIWVGDEMRIFSGFRHSSYPDLGTWDWIKPEWNDTQGKNRVLRELRQ